MKPIRKSKGGVSQVDYVKQSEYFEGGSEELLNQEIMDIEEQKKFIIWVQSFSKKIIIILFFVYLLISAFAVILIWKGFQLGAYAGIDTLISEMNDTFRVVIGGYLIKSALENSLKIGGNYYVGIADARLRAMRKKYNVGDCEPEYTPDDEVVSGDETV